MPEQTYRWGPKRDQLAQAAVTAMFVWLFVAYAMFLVAISPFVVAAVLLEVFSYFGAPSRTGRSLVL